MLSQFSHYSRNLSNRIDTLLSLIRTVGSHHKRGTSQFGKTPAIIHNSVMILYLFLLGCETGHYRLESSNTGESMSSQQPFDILESMLDLEVVLNILEGELYIDKAGPLICGKNRLKIVRPI